MGDHRVGIAHLCCEVSLLTVPDPKGDGTMAEIERDITIDAPVERVFAYHASPDHLTAWPHVAYVTGQQELPNASLRLQWTNRLSGMRVDGTTEDIEQVANQRRVSKVRGAIDLMLTATFQPEDGGAKMTIEVEITLPIPLIGGAIGAFIIGGMESEIDATLANVKARMEA
jgi:uncharacterized protein YndB with AHSA1/START domain